MRASLRGLGFVAGIVCAIAAHDREPSFLLAVFVFFTASYLVGSALPDVISKPKRVRRALYLLLLPAASVGVLAGTYLLVDRMWLAVLVAFVAGPTVHRLVSGVLFPGIAREEKGWRAWLREERWTEPRRPDVVAGRWRRSGLRNLGRDPAQPRSTSSIR